jgi:hypothetical protein
MRVTCNLDELLNSLKKLEEEVTRKLEGMVEIFIYNITVQAIDNTPYGNIEDYAKLYQAYARRRSLPAEAGAAKGGWMVTMNEPSPYMFIDVADSSLAANTKGYAATATTFYKLGQDVYISNNIPYVSNEGWPYKHYKDGSPVKSLESGGSDQAPQGIMKPTLASIIGVYQLKLDEYYRAT